MNDIFSLMRAEIGITIIIFLLLFARLGRGMNQSLLLSLVQVLLLINAVLGFVQPGEGRLFDGMFHTSALIAFEKNILAAGTYLITLLFADALKKDAHMAEFLLLMLSALLGMNLMISSGNLLMFFLSLELSTIPIAAMANFDLEKKASSEGAMKMILSSAFSSGILLFGISLIYGITGTIRFDELAAHLNSGPLTILAFIFLVAAFGFKLSVVPFHLWTADVYEGSPMANTAFLSVISKGSMAFIFLSTLYNAFQPLQQTWYELLMILSVASMLVGNLFAIRQQNIKRFLAFSSIAQVGFILLGMSGNSVAGSSSVVYFVLVYSLSNLAVFGVASVISDRTGKEDLDDYKGLYRNNPFLSWILALGLFSLAGIPPTAGFFAKLYLLTAGAARGNYWFIGFAALNMIVSLYYYLRIIRAVFMDSNETPIGKIRTGAPENFALLICGGAVVIIGFLSWIYEFINELM